MLFRCNFTLLLCCLCLGLTGQTLIQGQLKDELGQDVVGANIYLAGTYDGTSSDLEGHFSFKTTTRDSQVLIISYLGYTDIEKQLWITDETIELELTLLPEKTAITEITVSAGAFRAGDAQKGAVLSALDIVTTAGATGDLVGALQTLPGTTPNGEDGRLFVRGGAAYETRTFIDGLYVAQPYNSSVPNLPSRGRFSPFLFKGTTFSSGGYSAEYGQALSAALILETQDLAPKTLTSISLMSVGLGANHSHRWENASLQFGLDYTDLAPYQALFPNQIDWNRSPHGYNGQLVYRLAPNPGQMLKVQANLQFQSMDFAYRSAENNNDEDRLQLQDQFQTISASWEQGLGDAWRLYLGQSYMQQDKNIATYVDVGNLNRAAISKAKLSYGLSNQVLLRAGVEYWSENYQEAITIPSSQEHYQHNLPEEYVGSFFEAAWQIGDQWEGRSGIRVDRSKQLDQWAISPRLAMSYQLAEHSKLAFAYGEFSQSPSAELLLEHGGEDFEEASHWLVNYQWQKEDRTLRIEAYEKDYRQLLLTGPAATGQSNQTGFGYARGLELFYRDKKSIKYTDFWLSYSYLDTRRLFLDFPSLAQPSFAAKHNMSVVVKRWFKDLNSQVGLSFQYSSPRPFDDPNTPAFNDGQTKAFRDLSFNWSYLTRIAGNFTILHLSVNNFLGFDNEFGRQFSQQPNADGTYSSVVIRPPARSFAFVGLFVSIE